MKFISFFLVFFMLMACAPEHTQKELTAPFLASVLTMNPLKPEQPPGEAPTYTLTTEQFQFLTDFNHLDGKYFKLYRGGEVAFSSSRIEFLGKNDPRLNYKIIDHVVVPKDYATMAMLSAYYQFDFVSSKLETISGVSMDQIMDKFGKLEIFFEPKFSEQNGGILNETYQKENAAYFPEFRKFILFSRSADEKVPLSMNLQVISHEFGHSLWDYGFNHGISKSCERLSVEYAMRGLNEGFADFFSYTLTGSTNILQNSLQSAHFASMRNFSVIRFGYEKIADIADTNNQVCNQSHYCTGTVFANSLFQAQKILGYNSSLLTGEKSRSEFFKIILHALQNTKQNMEKLPAIPQYFDTCTSGNETSSFYNGEILGSFFRSFLNQIEDNDVKGILHCVLVQNFGNLGFPTDYRLGICV